MYDVDISGGCKFFCERQIHLSKYITPLPDFELEQSTSKATQKIKKEKDTKASADECRDWEAENNYDTDIQNRNESDDTTGKGNIF